MFGFFKKKKKQNDLRNSMVPLTMSKPAPSFKGSITPNPAPSNPIVDNTTDMLILASMMPHQQSTEHHNYDHGSSASYDSGSSYEAGSSYDSGSSCDAGSSDCGGGGFD